MTNQVYKIIAVCVAAVSISCGGLDAPDVALEGLALDSVGPKLVVPGTSMLVTGRSFVDKEWGTTVLRLKGTAGSDSVDLRLPAVFIDYDHLAVTLDAATIVTLGSDADFIGTAVVEVTSEVDGRTYRTTPLDVALEVRTQLTPQIGSMQSSGVIFVNDTLAVTGDGFLLGGGEGKTVARVSGCFRKGGGGPCNPVAPTDVPIQMADRLKRDRGAFAFSPRIAGIEAGSFEGEVVIANVMASGETFTTAATAVQFDVVEAQVFRVNPAAVSLGQYVMVDGGGFVGGEAGASMELELRGTFTPTGGSAANVTLSLIPEFVAGKLVRYTVNTDDELGHALDLRKDTGTFSGTIRPITVWQGKVVQGRATAVQLAIAPVKQVVFLDFRPTYIEGLRDFGLRAVESQIRERVLTVVRQAYQGVNIEFRTTAPSDFALFEHVELHGKDPNGLDYFGYDNTPGKDNGNMRLHDRLGGANAQTQAEGLPGFGGVFVRSLLGFSLHPGGLTKKISGADPLFDKIFDAFRPDLDGAVVTAGDLAPMVSVPTDGRDCPATDRRGRISCAIYVLGNLIGGTLAHEIGHSLGLANPFQDGFHNFGDEPNRLMDNGGDRPFAERAELQNMGPGVFCSDEYEYLRGILPSSEPANEIERPSCF